jgi:hypothetical protein
MSGARAALEYFHSPRDDSSRDRPSPSCRTPSPAPRPSSSTPRPTRAGNDEGEPDVVLACAGDIPTLETVAAAAILRQYLSDLRIRVINVVDLMRLQPPSEHPHGLSDAEFDALFTCNRPVVFAEHGGYTVEEVSDGLEHHAGLLGVRGLQLACPGDLPRCRCRGCSRLGAVGWQLRTCEA